MDGAPSEWAPDRLQKPAFWAAACNSAPVRGIPPSPFAPIWRKLASRDGGHDARPGHITRCDPLADFPSASDRLPTHAGRPAAVSCPGCLHGVGTGRGCLPGRTTAAPSSSPLQHRSRLRQRRTTVLCGKADCASVVPCGLSNGCRSGCTGYLDRRKALESSTWSGVTAAWAPYGSERADADHRKLA